MRCYICNYCPATDENLPAYELVIDPLIEKYICEICIEEIKSILYDREEDEDTTILDRSF